MAETLADNYGLSEVKATAHIAAPSLFYQPPNPASYRPAIGVIGCGGIAVQHLNAYRHAGYRVAALCDHTEAKARDYQTKFYPDAVVATDYRELLAREEIDVVDITTHPIERLEIMEAALLAGKHVLSQKPFVLDLDEGERLVRLAEEKGLRLAVNQNGRWAPHFSYLRQAVNAGVIGRLQSANFTLHWYHGWIIGTPYETIQHLILYDFGIHWFDLTACLFDGRRALSVFAAEATGSARKAKIPMLAQAIVEYDDGLASLLFNAQVTHGQEDRTYLAGTEGSAISIGPSLSEQRVTIFTENGQASPLLKGTWFREGFHGAMGELLCAIEENRPPSNSARENLKGLELCFAAVASAVEKKPIIPGSVKRLYESGKI